MLAFLALYVPLVGWRLQRRLGLYLVALYVLSQVPPFGTSRLIQQDKMRSARLVLALLC